jgi:hypothetical protein
VGDLTVWCVFQRDTAISEDPRGGSSRVVHVVFVSVRCLVLVGEPVTRSVLLQCSVTLWALWARYMNNT